MPIYPAEVNKIAGKAVHARKLAAPDAQATAASFECGSFVRFELSENEGTIELAYVTNGCGYLVAAAEAITGYLQNQTLADLHGLADEELTAVVGLTYPKERQQCLRVVLDGVHAVFANLRERRLAVSSPSEAMVCTCFSVSEEAIENCITQNALTSVEEVTALCRAGGGCGSCRMLIGEMLDASHML